MSICVVLRARNKMPGSFVAQSFACAAWTLATPLRSLVRASAAGILLRALRQKWKIGLMVLGLAFSGVVTAQTCPDVFAGAYLCQGNSFHDLSVEIRHTKVGETPALVIGVPNPDKDPIPCVNTHEVLKKELCTATSRQVDPEAKKLCDKLYGETSLLISSRIWSNQNSLRVENTMRRKAFVTGKTGAPLLLKIELDKLSERQFELKVFREYPLGGVESYTVNCQTTVLLPK